MILYGYINLYSDTDIVRTLYNFGYIQERKRQVMPEKKPSRFKGYPLQDRLSITCLYSAFETIKDKDYFFSGECHDFWEMVYVMSENVGVSSNDRIYKLSRGDVIFHKPMEFHRLWSVDGKKAHLFIMSFDLEGECASEFEKLVVSLPEKSRRIFADLISDFYARASRFDGENETSFDMLVSKWDSSGMEEQTIKHRIELLLCEILADKYRVGTTSPFTSRSAEIYRKTVQLLEQNVYGHITTEQIAESLSYSPAYIKRIFAGYSDIGIHAYYTRLKINKAIELMKDGKTVGEASELLGFGNANYFGIVFKREMGMSPKKYVMGISQDRLPVKNPQKKESRYGK